MIILREIRGAGIVTSTTHTKNAHVTPLRQSEDKRWSGTPAQAAVSSIKV